jgi:hypothetical protein
VLIGRDDRGWALATMLATVALSLVYWQYARDALYGATGGSWTGLAFGIAGTALMLAAALLSVRKKLRTRRIGSAQGWMRFHLWGGLLSVPLILFHSGFALGGPLTTILMALFAIVIVSGIFGLVVQQFVPRLMFERLPAETLRNQIEHVRQSLAVDAYEVVAAVTGHLSEAVEEQEWLATEKRAGWKAAVRHEAATSPATGSETIRATYLEHVRPYLRRRTGAAMPVPDLVAPALEAPADLAPRIEQLRALCEESRQLDVQQRLHAWLHNWLFVHAPLSIALFVLVAFHIWFALKY